MFLSNKFMIASIHYFSKSNHQHYLKKSVRHISKLNYYNFSIVNMELFFNNEDAKNIVYIRDAIQKMKKSEKDIIFSLLSASKLNCAVSHIKNLPQNITNEKNYFKLIYGIQVVGSIKKMGFSNWRKAHFRNTSLHMVLIQI